MKLRVQMAEIVCKAAEKIKKLRQAGDTEPHHEVCSQLADEYDLWYPEEAPADLENGPEELQLTMPAWLCRVVEGVMRDLGEGLDPNEHC